MSALQVVGTVQSGPSAEIYDVTPAVATRWLSRNVRNRSIRDRIVNAYARDMTSGNWQLTGEAIKFDTNGALSDGQHRLAAVIKSGVSVRMLVVRGIEPEAQAVMDTGVKRSQSDALTLAGLKRSTILVAAARIALGYPELGFVAPGEQAPTPTNTEIAAFIAQHPEIHRAAEMAQHFYPAFDAQPRILTVAWMRLSLIDIEACAQFFAAIANNMTSGPGDPRLALARRLNTMRRDRMRVDAAVQLSLIFRAWNKWRAGQTAASLPLDAKIPERLR